MDIIVTGTLAFDHIMNLPSKFSDYIMPDQLHMLNVSFNADNMRKEQGGTAGNIAYTLGLLGIKSTIIAAAGHDFSSYQKHLEQVGVDCNQVKIYPDQLTAVGFCITDQDDNQIWGFSHNASKNNHQLTIPAAISQNSFAVIGPSGKNGILNFINQCHHQQLPYLFDPAFLIPELSKEQLIQGIQGARIIIGNDYEITLIKKKTHLTNQDLIDNNRILITTLGSHGSQIQHNANKQKLTTIQIPPAKPLNTSDPTGAGDAYRAGFLAGFLRDFPIQTCGQMGSLTAAYTVEKYGTTTHKFTLEEFQQRYSDNFHADLPDELTQPYKHTSTSLNSNQIHALKENQMTASRPQLFLNHQTNHHSSHHQPTPTDQIPESQENHQPTPPSASLKQTLYDHTQEEQPKTRSPDHQIKSRSGQPLNPSQTNNQPKFNSESAKLKQKNNPQEDQNSKFLDDNNSDIDDSVDDNPEEDPSLESMFKKSTQQNQILRQRSNEISKLAKTAIRQIRGQSTDDIAQE